MEVLLFRVRDDHWKKEVQAEKEENTQSNNIQFAW